MSSANLSAKPHLDRAGRILAKTATLVGLAIAVSSLGCGGAGGTRLKRIEPDANGVILCDAPDYECDLSVKPLDCSAPAYLDPNGRVTDFSCSEWNAGMGKWCTRRNGHHGSIFSFKGTAPTDTNAVAVDETDGSLLLSLNVGNGSYGGGGLAFEGGCVDASAFTGVEFTVAVAMGSLIGCSYQLQLQTFEQRPMSQSPPGGCDDSAGGSCYNFPAATGLPAPSTDATKPTLVSIPFSSFGGSVDPAPAQIVGLQWQVNSAGGQCDVGLRLDDIRFIPAASPADAGISDAGTPADASSSS
jgi:hypothetical protein